MSVFVRRPFYMIFFIQAKHPVFFKCRTSTTGAEMKSSAKLKPARGLYGLMLTACLPACSGKMENSGIPKPASELSPDDVSDSSVRNGNERWKALAAALKLKNDGSSDALKTPSDYFGSSEQNIEDLTTLSDTLADKHLATARSTGCAGVESFELIGNAQTLDISVGFPQELDTAKWYLMKYRRKKADGTADTVVNGALVSVPAATGSSYPVVLYSHAGDRGLPVIEIAAVFGTLQSSRIIVAPAFPGESICKFFTSPTSKTSCDANGTYFDAVGTSDPYSTDAEDLLAAHNCLVTPNAIPDYGSKVISKIKTQTPAGLTVGPVPVSTIAGASRGGMAALIALAKNSAMLRKNAADTSGSIPYTEAKYFNCAATNINPTTFTYKEFRVFLEAIVKGTADALDASTLPTAPQLMELMKPYAKGDMPVEDAALLLQMRDAAFNAKLSLESVRNWSNNGKGSFLSIHATLDKRIPISQGTFGSSVFNAINARIISRHAGNPSLPAGVFMTNLGTIAQLPYSSDGGKTLGANFTMHGDQAWFSSLTGVNTNTAFGETTAPLDSSSPFYNKKPADAFSAWMNDSTTGCGASVP
jgi:hypothetical protein